MKVSNKMNKEVSSLINTMVISMYMQVKADAKGDNEASNGWFENKEEARAKLVALGFTDLAREN